VFIIKHHLDNLGSEEDVSAFIKNILLWWLGYGVHDGEFFQIVCGAHSASCALDSGEYFVWTEAFGERSFVQRRGVYLDLNFVRFLASYLIELRDNCIFHNIVAVFWRSRSSYFNAHTLMKNDDDNRKKFSICSQLLLLLGVFCVHFNLCTLTRIRNPSNI
jgi:hypothetical protein